MLSKQPNAECGTIQESPLYVVDFGLLPQPVPIQHLCCALLRPLLPSPQRYTFCAKSPAVSPEQHNHCQAVVMSHAWWNRHFIDFAILHASTSISMAAVTRLCMCRPNLTSEQTYKPVTSHTMPPLRRIPIEVSEDVIHQSAGEGLPREVCEGYL